MSRPTSRRTRWPVSLGAETAHLADDPFHGSGGVRADDPNGDEDAIGVGSGRVPLDLLARYNSTAPGATVLTRLVEAAVHTLHFDATPATVLPAVPGLYTLAASGPDGLRMLDLAELEPDDLLGHRVLYLGKAEDSLADRLQGTHFMTGESGRLLMDTEIGDDGVILDGDEGSRTTERPKLDARTLKRSKGG
jgi:hypothetical protein